MHCKNYRREWTGLTSEKTKINIATVIGVVGVIISMITALILFGPHFGLRLLAVNENVAIFILAIGIAMAALGISTAIRIGTRSTKEKIADFANPILKSKGKVSLREIAGHLKMKWGDVAAKEYLEKTIKEMFKEGYFEDTRVEDGWLVRDVIPCPYCGEPVRLTERKCSNCGAAIKK
jgi:ribosomal protein S27AE